MNLFLDIGWIVIAAGIFSLIARLFKQPIIPAFIIAGIYLGPIQGLITDQEIISSISEIGIALLLFSAGLELNIKKLAQIGKVAALGALSHMAVLFVAGFAIFSMLGYDSITSIYIGLILIFSSTLVVVKLLSDRKELDTLHGRLIVAILLVQDMVAIIALSLLSSLGNGAIGNVMVMFLQAGFVVFAGFALAYFVFARIFRFAAKNDEMLFILSIFILFAFTVIFYGLGFSIAIGAFVAGLMIGHLPYKFEVLGQVKGIKEFFSIIFFVSIGLSLRPVEFGAIALPIAVLFAMILVLIPLAIMFMLAMFGYKRRTAFITSISLAQVSEFSLILVSTGLAQGHISGEIYSMTIILALLTIISTSYCIKYSDRLYELIGRKITIFERLTPHNKERMGYEVPGEHYDTVLVGHDRIGYSIYRKLKAMKKKVLVVDLNPDIISKLTEEQVPCIYGDISDKEIEERLELEHVDLVISTIPKYEDNEVLLCEVRKKNPAATVVLTSYNATQAMDLYSKGADYVIVPHFLGGEHLSIILGNLAGRLKERVDIRMRHMKALEERIKRHKHHS